MTISLIFNLAQGLKQIENPKKNSIKIKRLRAKVSRKSQAFSCLRSPSVIARLSPIPSRSAEIPMADPRSWGR